jgi:hypothetical protein
MHGPDDVQFLGQRQPFGRHLRGAGEHQLDFRESLTYVRKGLEKKLKSLARPKRDRGSDHRTPADPERFAQSIAGAAPDPVRIEARDIDAAGNHLHGSRHIALHLVGELQHLRRIARDDVAQPVGDPHRQSLRGTGRGVQAALAGHDRRHPCQPSRQRAVEIAAQEVAMDHLRSKTPQDADHAYQPGPVAGVAQAPTHAEGADGDVEITGGRQQVAAVSEHEEMGTEALPVEATEHFQEVGLRPAGDHVGDDIDDVDEARAHWRLTDMGRPGFANPGCGLVPPQGRRKRLVAAMVRPSSMPTPKGRNSFQPATLLRSVS